jgi:hypothetical protein
VNETILRLTLVIVNDNTMQALRTVFDDDLLLAALDSVDNRCGSYWEFGASLHHNADNQPVFKCNTSWNRTFYCVQSTADPSTGIQVNFLGEQSALPWSCECPAFVKHMLLDDKILMVSPAFYIS